MNFKCKICDCVEYEVGPSSGMADNVRCARCGARYNMTPFGIDFLGTATKPKVRIAKEPRSLEFEDKEFETVGEAIDWVKSQFDSRPFGHKYLVYNEDNILVLDG